MVDIRRYILEAVHDFEETAEEIFEKLGLRDLSQFPRTKKIPRWFLNSPSQGRNIRVIFSEDLKSNVAKEYHKRIRLTVILKRDSGDVGGHHSIKGWYDFRKHTLNLVLPIYVEKMFDTWLKLKKVEKSDRGYMELVALQKDLKYLIKLFSRNWSERKVITKLDHELNHWGDDVFDEPLGTEDTPWTEQPMEIDAVVSQMNRQYMLMAPKAWNRLSLDQAIKLTSRGKFDNFNRIPAFILPDNSIVYDPHKGRQMLINALRKHKILGKRMA